jgi:mannose-1-phosphate guanylyltransferase
MNALILAAGFGTRLKPLTNTIPKCLVPINGKPLLGLWIEKLSKLSVSKILINTHYLPNQVSNFIIKNNYKEICKIVNEDVLLGTAGTLLNNINDLLLEDCILLHADNYTKDDINKLINAHHNRPKNCLITMLVFETNNPSSCGILELKDNIVVNIYEKVDNPPGNLANGAIYILSKEAINIIKNDFPKAKDFVNDILKNFLGKIFSYHTKEIFLDIGTIENYLKANTEC